MTDRSGSSDPGGREAQSKVADELEKASAAISTGEEEPDDGEAADQTPD